MCGLKPGFATRAPNDSTAFHADRERHLGFLYLFGVLKMCVLRVLRALCPTGGSDESQRTILEDADGPLGRNHLVHRPILRGTATRNRSHALLSPRYADARTTAVV